jgi:hypothetical protein
MIEKIKSIFSRIKYRLLKNSPCTYLPPNENNDVVNQLIEKDLIPHGIRDQYLQNKKFKKTSELIESLVIKRIEDREKQTDKRYSEIINKILNEKISR